MSAFQIKSDGAVHCVELTSGEKLTGTFRFDQDGIRAYIYRYEGFFFIKREEPIVLLTEKNEIVSLYSILTGPRGHNSRMIGLTRTIYRQDITSNIAVIGHDEWASEEYTLSEAGDGRPNTTSACS